MQIPSTKVQSRSKLWDRICLIHGSLATSKYAASRPTGHYLPGWSRCLLFKQDCPGDHSGDDKTFLVPSAQIKVDCIWGRVLAEKRKRSILPIASRVTFAFYSSWTFEFLLFVSRSHHINLLLFLALRNVYCVLHLTQRLHNHIHSARGSCVLWPDMATTSPCSNAG